MTTKQWVVLEPASGWAGELLPTIVAEKTIFPLHMEAPQQHQLRHMYVYVHNLFMYVLVCQEEDCVLPLPCLMCLEYLIMHTLSLSHCMVV